MGFPHAMVLDTIQEGKFIFKNTRSENKKFEIEVNHNDAPDEFFIVHIKLDLTRLEQIRQRLTNKSRRRKNEDNEGEKTDRENQLSDGLEQVKDAGKSRNDSKPRYNSFKRDKNEEFAKIGATSKGYIDKRTSTTFQNHKRINSKIFEINHMSQKLTEIIGYRYKLIALDRDDFTTVYVSISITSQINFSKLKAGKLCHIKKFTLLGLESFSKESILGITPVLSENGNTQTVQPLHQFIQDYNCKQFLLMLFVGEKFNTSFCHFNGTEKKIETLARQNQFYINGRTFSYENEKWCELYRSKS